MKIKAVSVILAILTCLIFSLGALGCVQGDEPKYDPPSVNEPKNESNFQSLSTATFDNINGKTVTVDLFKRSYGEPKNNPNFGQGVLIYQCIKYKQAHPDEEVYLSFTSFHVSVVASVCLKESSEYYGYMKSIYGKEYDDDGFVRISYLLVCAAKIGINVTVIGQIDANPVDQNGVSTPDKSFEEYFTSYLDVESEIEGKKIGDFLTFRKTYWTSYGDKSASDMMHVKSCTVSNYIDKDGVEHGGSVWLSSTNLDGISSKGSNGNDSVQTGVIISDHEKIRKVVYNYTRAMVDYCGQEEIGLFRDKIIGMNTQQIDLILSGKEEEIAEDEQIVYLGSESDNVFEMHFTPLGGSATTWDAKYNPYCKYINKLLPSVSGSASITFAWNNVKYLTNFEFSKILANMIKTAFTENPRLTNRLYLRLPGFDTSVLNDLIEGENIGIKYVNKNLNVGWHSKDFQLSYVENFERHYVTVFNSLNFHQGAMSYQTNTILVINETKATGNNVYVDFGKVTTDSVINESDRINVK